MLMKYKDFKVMSNIMMKTIKGGHASQITCKADCPAGQSSGSMSGDSATMSCTDLTDSNGNITGVRITISGGLTIDKLCTANTQS
jgi:hypothetical protein